MKTLAELKAESPRYQDMSDGDFASMVYDKFYASKMSRRAFDIRAGIRPGVSAFQRFSDAAMDPFGVQDEIIGAGRFVGKLVSSGGSLAEASKAYSDAAEGVRAERELARQDYGYVPDIIGGFGTAGVGTAANAFKALPLLGRIKQGAKTGAMFGGAAGVGHSEGGITERLVGGATGAAMGAVAGPVISEVAAPVVGAGYRGLQHGARKGAEVLRDTFGDVIPTLKRSADQRMLRALQRGDMTPDEALAEYERIRGLGEYTAFGKKTDVGVPVTPADLSPALQRQGRALKTIPGRGSTMAEEVYGERQTGQFGRTMDYLTRSLKVTRSDYLKTKATLEKEMKEAADPLYAQFRAMKDKDGKPITIDVGPTLRDSIGRDGDLSPGLKKMMSKARGEFIDDIVIRDMDPFGKGRIRGRDMSTRLNAARFDNAKRSLDQMIQAELNNGRNYSASLLTQLKNDLVSVADRASMRAATQKQSTKVWTAKGLKPHSFEVPVVDAKGRPVFESIYARARDAYATPAQIDKALGHGRTFATGDSEVTAAAYKAMSTAEKRAFRIGMARQLRKELGNKEIGQNFIGYFRRPNTQEILSDIMSPAEYRRFMSLIDAEKGFAASNQVIRGGSPTADKLADVEDLNAVLTMGRVLKEKGLAGAVFDAVGTGIERVLRMREADAFQLARMMFETDPAKVRATFARLKLLYGPKKVSQAMNLTRQIAEQRAGSFAASAALEAGQQGAVSPGDHRLPAQF